MYCRQIKSRNRSRVDDLTKLLHMHKIGSQSEACIVLAIKKTKQKNKIFEALLLLGIFKNV